MSDETSTRVWAIALGGHVLVLWNSLVFVRHPPAVLMDAYSRLRRPTDEAPDRVVFLRGSLPRAIEDRFALTGVSLESRRHLAFAHGAIWHAPTVEDASALLRRLVDNAVPGVRSALADVASDVDALYLGFGGPASAVAVVANALQSSQLFAALLPERSHPLHRPRESAARDLKDVGAILDLLDPPASELPSVDTWVSFQVVDEEGRGADGRFTIALGGRIVEDVLDQRRHRFEPVHPSASVRVLLEDLAWPTMSRILPDLEVTAPNGVAADPIGILVEIVDDDGLPLRAVVDLLGDDIDVSGASCDHRMEQPLPAGSRLRLALKSLAALAS